MSLKHIENRRDPTIFGADLNVLIGDVIINGNLDVQGVINGKSDQGQNENNVWTGTNEWSVFRPQTTPTTGVGFSGVNLGLEQSKIIADSIVNQGATWTGANTFANNISTSISTPLNATDAVPCAYVKSRASTQSSSYLSSANTWTGTNNFNFLPLCIEPVADAEIATKNYTDSQIAAFSLGGTTTEIRQNSLLPTVWNDVAVSVSIIGGGGGSTSGYNATDGWGYSGGSGAMGTLLLLTAPIGGVSKGRWSIEAGAGGTPGIGTTPPASYSGSGGSTILSLTPVAGQGLNPATVQVLSAGGGGGNTNSSGQRGNPSLGGVYTNVNPDVFSPWASVNGALGQYNSGATPQWSGIEQYGWGANSLAVGDGGGGFRGGWGIVNYLD